MMPVNYQTLCYLNRRKLYTSLHFKVNPVYNRNTKSIMCRLEFMTGIANQLYYDFFGYVFQVFTNYLKL